MPRSPSTALEAHMGRPAGNAGGMGNACGLGAGPTGGSDIGMMTRDDARINSQGPANASPTGVAHANSNSVLAGSSGGTVLTGLVTGMAVIQNGVQIGTVQKIITNGRGIITRVLVRGAGGQLFSLSPTSLSLNGGILTTTAMLTRH
jgi:hypothetical protein